MSVSRVAFLAPFGLRPKGTTVSRALPIARVLAAQGVQIRLVIPPWDDPQAAGHAGHEPNLEIVNAGLAAGLVQPFQLAGDLQRLVQEFEPDVVHVFKPIGYSGLLGWWWARTWRGSGAPLLVLDCDDLEGPAGWAGRQGHRSLGLIRGLQEVLTIRQIGRVTVASRWLEAHVRRLGVATRHMLYLPNGWQHEQERTEEAGDRGSPTLLWYTRFTEANPERAADLLAPLLTADPQLRVIVLGDEIVPGARSRAQSSFAEAGIGPQVEWLGYAPDRLEQLVRTRDLVAVYPLDDDLANRARSPAKIVELMSHGIPVVAEAVGEARSYLADVAPVCLVAPDDGPKFRSLVSTLIQQPELRREVGSGAKASAAKFEWGRLAGGLGDWYAKVRT